LRRFFFLLLSLAPFLFTACFESHSDELSRKVAELKATRDSLARIEVDLYRNRYRGLSLFSDTVKAGEGLFQVMQRIGVDENQRRQIVLALEDSVELSNLRVGEVFHIAQNGNGDVQVFRYAPNPATVHLLFRNPYTRAFEYKRIDKPLERRQSVFSGVLEDGSTLNGTLLKAGIPLRMAGTVSAILQCKIPFRNARAGDHFKVMIEESFFQDTLWISGTVLYAEFEGRVVGHHEAFFYEDPDPKSTYNAYYTASGEALIYDGLRYPLDRLHITSPFGYRIHPITGRYTLHNGIDYGSPYGAPVYAVADGKVVTSGYDEFSGNKIAIKHTDNSTSWYLHLSARLVNAGAKVSPHQMIGRVGTTGRSTGPHLHFGFTDMNGRWINPLSKVMIATPKLSGDRLLRLQAQIKDIRSELRKTEKQKPRGSGASANIRVNSRTVHKVHGRR
jgi:murein DD-endopeptidase MepM/ murein hydrolase activator NlpD